MPNRSKIFSEKMPLRIRSLRKRDHYTQKELAKKLYKSESTVRMWELGKSEPDTQSINAMAEVFNITTDYIIGLPFTVTIPMENWHADKIEDYNKSDDATKEFLMYKYGHGIFESHDSTSSMTEEEAALIEAYRSQPELQSAVKRVLGLPDGKIFLAAETKPNNEYVRTSIRDIDPQELEALRNAPIDESDVL